MARVTIDIADAVLDWLEGEARVRRVTVGDLVTFCIEERRGGVVLTQQERYILGCFHNVSTRAGWPVPARMLWTNWGVRGTAGELTAALDGLTRKGLISVTADRSSFVLTDSGFAHAV